MFLVAIDDSEETAAGGIECDGGGKREMDADGFKVSTAEKEERK